VCESLPPRGRLLLFAVIILVVLLLLVAILLIIAIVVLAALLVVLLLLVVFLLALAVLASVACAWQPDLLSDLQMLRTNALVLVEDVLEIAALALRDCPQRVAARNFILAAVLVLGILLLLLLALALVLVMLALLAVLFDGERLAERRVRWQEDVIAVLPRLLALVARIVMANVLLVALLIASDVRDLVALLHRELAHAEDLFLVFLLLLVVLLVVLLIIVAASQHKRDAEHQHQKQHRSLHFDGDSLTRCL